MIVIRHMAQVCREAMRSYYESLGDLTARHWDSLNDRQRRLSICIASYILNNPNTSPMAAHDVWMDEMIDTEGWTFGDLDERKKTHPNIREWEDLPQHVQTSYAISIGIVRGMRDVSMTVRCVPWSPPEVRHMTGQETFTVPPTNGGLTVEEIGTLKELGSQLTCFAGLGEEQSGPSEYEEKR